MLTAIVGINWGDEGKGRMVDLLSENYDIIVRYQGGNNAGHTVINDKGKFILNLLPSGILREQTINVLGPGMVIDIEHLVKEIASLTEKGIHISPENLKISDKAVICMPYHKQLDILEEERLKDAKFGSTRRGIAPVYGDKYMKKVLKMGDLLHSDTLMKKIEALTEWKNLTVHKGYGADAIKPEEIYHWVSSNGNILKDHICDTTIYLNNAIKDGKNIMFEAQLGALRDIDYGIFPYTSSSSTIAAYAPIGAGIPFAKIDSVIGITKAFSSCVGEGPFACELFGKSGNELREAGQEYGAATGRPRRVGGFDVVASKYGCMVQGATELVLTKLDILSYLEKIPVCVAYEIDGKITTDFVLGDQISREKPVYKYFDGFKTDISKCRHKEELPKEALDYIHFIEEAMGVPIKYVSVGAAREDYIVM
mgnify:CR=1 FL=1